MRVSAAARMSAWRKEIPGAIDAHESARKVRPDLGGVEQNVRHFFTGWHVLLAKPSMLPAQRQFLRELLAGPLSFTAEGHTHRIEG